MFKKIMLILLSICLFTVDAWGGIPLPDLSRLEQSVGDSPEVLAALSELVRDEHLLDHQKQRATPQIFLGLSAGYYNEPIARTLPDTERYSNFKIVAGVSFPLLGTWSQQKISVLRAELQAVQSRYASRLAKSRNLTALRKAYAVIWAEQRKEPFLKAFLANETEIDKIFTRRREDGYLLETDRLEFSSAFENSRRELALARFRKSQALNVISLATGKEYRENGTLEAPSIANINFTHSGSAGSNPETELHADAIKIYEKILKESSKLSREATLDVGAFYTDDNPGTPGTGIYAGFTIREPFGSIRSKVDAAKQAASADLSRAMHEENAAKMRFEFSLRENIALRDYCDEAIKFAITRLKSSCEAVRMRELRHKKLEGDTLESLQQSRYDYLRTAIDLIDAELYYVQTCIELASLLWPNGDEPQERVSPLKNVENITQILFSDVWLDFGKEKPPLVSNYVGDGRRYGVYVWNTAPFLDKNGAQKNLDEIKKLGFDRALISFNSEQLKLLRTAKGRYILLSLIDRAKNMGLVMELLLGDPAWALPQERASLGALLRFFESFPFSAVHLDIEPDSLPNSENRRPELLRELFETFKMANASTSRPLSISMHPRYFEGELGKITAALLENVKIDEIALMIYSTNMDGVRARFSDIVSRFPKQKFALAQSVESALPPDESWFKKVSRESFYRYTKNTYPSVLVQAWEDYQKMKP